VNRGRNRQFCEAARQHFGTRQAALTTAGINVADVTHRKPKPLDRQAMLLGLRTAGPSASHSSIVENRSHALAFRCEFESWKVAIARTKIE